MERVDSTPLWIIATGVIVAGLWFLREPLTEFVLAVILWLTIDGAAKAMRRRAHVIPPRFALPLAIFGVLGLVAVIFYVVAINVGAMASHSSEYQVRLNAMVAQTYHALGLSGTPPTVKDMAAHVDPTQLVGQVGAALQSTAGNAVFILIFLGFLFASSPVMSKKLDAIFTSADQREHVRLIIASIRSSMERYMWVQTLMSLLDTVLTFVTLSIIGLHNALFWAFLIFFLNYIPTIGSIIAVILPTAFALLQFPDVGHVAAVALGVGVWQFVIGNFIQPRMTGESLNLSTVIVLLALAIWGLLWGIAGAFLAAPLTVMLMIVLAQFPDTKWIAILLSADGKPTLPSRSSLESEVYSD